VVEPGHGELTPPATCPSCGAVTESDGDFLFCSNQGDCPDAQVGLLEHFVSVVDCQGFGPKLLRRLYDLGHLRDPADFYTLTGEQLLEAERMGKVLARKLLGSVAERRRLDLATFLRSLAIEELGKHVAAILAGYGSLDRVRALTEEELTQVPTIGETIAHAVVRGLGERAALIDKLLRQVTIAAGDAGAGANAGANAGAAGDAGAATLTPRGLLAGKSFIFTGKLTSMERRQAQQRVLAAGGRAPSSVTGDLDYLVVGGGGDERESSKRKAADKLRAKGAKLRIITEAEFVAMLDEAATPPSASTSSSTSSTADTP